MSKPEKVKSCEWLSVTKDGIVECKALPAKLATRCGKFYCIEFHYKLAKNFKPFEEPAKP